MLLYFAIFRAIHLPILINEFEETETTGLIFLLGPVWVYVAGFSGLAASLLLIRLTMKPTR
jgi:hypothetical protein